MLLLIVAIALFFMIEPETAEATNDAMPMADDMVMDDVPADSMMAQ